MTGREAKAYAKALRPWYRKKRYWALGLIGGIVVISVVAGSSKTTVAHPAKDDVSIDSCAVDGSGYAAAQLAITNHSSKRSNYIVTVRFIAPDGALWDTALTGQSEIDGGQSATQNAQSIKSAAPVVTCEVGNVTRYATAKT